MSRRLVVLGTIFALLVGAFPPTALAEEPTSAPERAPFERLSVSGKTDFKPALVDQSKKITVVVKLDGKSLGIHAAEAKARGKSLSNADKAKIVSDLKAAQAPVITRAEGLGATIRSTYQTVYNGFSVRIARGQVAQLEELPGVSGVFGVATSTPDNERSVPYIGAPAAWEDLGLTGNGVIVGVIDTGIDYYHANLGGSGDPQDFEDGDGLGTDGVFPTAKVAGGFDFVGDDYDANVDGSVAMPDPDPKDCFGHGSHVAGTAAGNGVLSDGSAYAGPYNATTVSANSWTIGPGVAPEATIYGYRVFGCEGSVENDIVVAAIDMAADDGVDVINMSLGSPFGGAEGIEQDSIEAAAALGTMVVASAGNSGPSAYITGAPGAADFALSVAAMDGGFATIPTATIDLAGVGTLANNNNSSALPVTADIMVLPDQGLVGPGFNGISLGCDPSEYAGAAGKIVITVRGVCARVDRAIFGQDAGAAAVIMLNNAASLPPFEGPIDGVSIAFLGASGTATVANAFLGADGDEHTITPSGTIPSPGYKALASFSSGGPRNGDSAVKPDVAAPGVSTVSTGSGTGTEPATMSGTSMASPHAAGVAALVRDAHPSWSPEAVKAAMMNTATVSPSLILTNSTRLVGSGLVQPRRAVDTLVYATTGPGLSSLNYGYEAIGAGGYSEAITITFHNTDTSAHSFDLANAFQSTQGAVMTLSAPTVNVPAGSTATVDATLSLTQAAAAALLAAEVSNFGALNTIRGAVTATPNPGGTGLYALRIPYLLAPRGLSNVTAGTPTAYTFNAPTASRTAPLSNAGIHAGIADVYSWGATDAANAGLGAIDVRNVGVQSLPGEFGGAPASDRLLVFAINVDGQWSNAATNEYDIAIDHNGDGKTDYFVVGVDFGVVTAGAFDGRMASFIFKVNKNGSLSDVGVWVATAPMNGSTILLPALASEIGLTASMKNTAFKYQVVSFQIFDGDGSGFDVVSTAEWDSHRPPTSTGDFIGLNPGAGAALTMTADITRINVIKTLGWLVVALDDANGTAQADTIAIGALPKTK